MKIKSTLAVIALTLAPSLALAQGCENHKVQQSASQCEVGQVWDSATSTCVAATSS